MTTIPALVFSVAALGANPEIDPDNVIYDFYADWCMPCQRMMPTISKLQRAGYPIQKVNVEQNRALAAKYRVNALPTLVLVVNGREVQRNEGALSERQLIAWSNRIPKNVPAQEEETLIAAENFPAVNLQSSPPPKSRSLPLMGETKVAEATPPKEKSKPFWQFPLRGKRREEEQPVPPSDDMIARANIDDAANDVQREVSPLTVCTRIRIKDEQGINYGSGTIIDSRPGRSIILTCGHIFRNVDDNTTIQVDLFDGERFETYVGRAIGHDLDADVGLIAIPTHSAVPVSSIADESYQVNRGQHVFSVGCGGGQPPERQQHRVTELNRYLGPDNVECTGTPIQGRSGGGLFDTNGQVIGVCIAADPKEDRGLYAGLKAVQHLLDANGLTRLYRTGPESPEVQNAPPIGVAVGNQDRMPSEFADSGMDSSDIYGSNPFAEATESSEAEFENSVDTQIATANGRGRFDSGADEGLLRTLAENGEAEVVCIIRPINNPRAASRVVIINRASSKFVSYLQGELNSQPQPTSAYFRTDGTTGDLPPMISDQLSPNSSWSQDRTPFRPAISESTSQRQAATAVATSQRPAGFEPTQQNAGVQPYRRSSESRQASAAWRAR